MNCEEAETEEAQEEKKEEEIEINNKDKKDENQITININNKKDDNINILENKMSASSIKNKISLSKSKSVRFKPNELRSRKNRKYLPHHKRR